jgi:hypothetical protein
MADKAQKAKGGLRTSTCADESYMSCRGGTAVSESLYGVVTYKSDQPLSGISRFQSAFPRQALHWCLNKSNHCLPLFILRRNSKCRSRAGRNAERESHDRGDEEQEQNKENGRTWLPDS